MTYQEQLKQLHEQDQKALAWILLAICRRCQTPKSKPFNDAIEAYLKGEIGLEAMYAACYPSMFDYYLASMLAIRYAVFYAAAHSTTMNPAYAELCVKYVAEALGVDPTDLLNQHLNPTAASVRGDN